MTNIGSDDFKDLVGENLSGVTFVQDYLQLQFNPPPMLNALTPVTVRSGIKEAKLGEDSFANLLIAQINKVVVRVEVRLEDALVIHFQDGSIISISLRRDDYVCPEAVYCMMRDNSAIVI